MSPLAFPKPARREPTARKPLRRSRRLRARGKTAHARRERDFDWMAAVASLPCVAYVLKHDIDRCEGRIEVDHAFGRRVADADRKTIPLCSKHHREKTGVVGGGGFLAGWSLALRRGWLEVAVAWTKAAVAARLATADRRRTQT